MKCEKHCQSSYTENYMLIALGNWTYNEWSDPFFSSSFVVCEKSYHCLWKIISLCFWDIPISTRFFEEALFITWSITLWILVEHHLWIVISMAFLLLLLLRTSSVKPRSTCERTKTCKSPTKEAISEEEDGGMIWLATWADEGHKDLSSGGHWCTGRFKDAFQFFVCFTTLTLISSPFSLWRPLRNYSYNPWELTTAWHSEELRSCLSMILIHFGQGTTTIYLFIPPLVFYLPYPWHSKRETLWVGA